MIQIGWLSAEGNFVSLASVAYWLQPNVYGNKDILSIYTIAVFVEDGQAPDCVLDISEKPVFEVVFG